MPQISRFYGIIISMFFGDYARPHFHVQYGPHRAVYGIEPIACLRGSLPSRAGALVGEWATSHKPELTDNWERASQFQPVESIQPLD